mgnify:CR=1 FL=1
MTKTEQLFIRACKSHSCKFRLERLYQRFYFGGYCNAIQTQSALIAILAGIVDKYTPMTVSEFIKQKAFNKDITPAATDRTATLDALVSKIRFTTRDRLEGLPHHVCSESSCISK